MKTCTFMGHRDFFANKYQKLYNEIEKLILQKNVRKFYVGTHGNFDKLVYTALTELEKEYDIEFWVVLAYLNVRKENVYYDIKRTLFPSVLESTPLKYAINKRNMFMIKNSQYMICGINNTFTNSYNYVEMALKKGLKIINVGEYNI